MQILSFSAPSAHIFFTVTPSISATELRQPQCTAAMTPCRASHSSAGTQSATKHIIGSPRSAVTSPSASYGVRVPSTCLSADEATRTSLPCTCRVTTQSLPPAPISAATRRKFSSTFACSSPRLEPRLRLAKSPSLTPP